MTMTLEIFKENLDVYGTDFARWPEPYRDQCADFLAQSQDAQDLYVQASMIDELFAPAKAPLPEGLLDRILSTSKKTSEN